MNAPLLIIVTGRPASGKTTLAHSLVRAIRCPVLCRDEFKEGAIQTLREPATPADHTLLNRQVYDAFFQAIELLLRNGITLVAEAAFQHKLWQPKLEPLQTIADMRLIVCSIAPAIARTRFVERDLSDTERRSYHGGTGTQSIGANTKMLINTYQPPQLEAVPLLTVDTSDGYKPTLEQIKNFALQPTAFRSVFG